MPSGTTAREAQTTMFKKNAAHEVKPKGDFWPSVRLLLLIILIGMLPVVMEQLDIQRENLKLVGRCIAGVGVLLIAFALVKEIGKVVAIMAVALLAFMLLVSEGLIEPPRLLQ